MSNELKIRKALTKDADKILKYLRKTADQTDFLSYTLDEFKVTIAQEVKYIQNLNKPNCAFFIAEIGGEIVGKVTMTGGKTSRTEHVSDLSISVDEDYWGRKIGSNLLQQALDWAYQSKVITKVALKVNHNNPLAIKLYQKFGFQEEGRLKNDLKVNGEYVDSILMGKIM